MESIAQQVAKHLLQIKAIKLEPQNHFTWASGWFSPIYCDNRKTLSYPDIRSYIRDAFVQTAQENFDELDVIAGVATGGIAHGALVAEKMQKPFVYVRTASKGHGLENRVEGVVKPGQNVLVIEDLISTGKSSLSAVAALRNSGCNVIGMIAIFTYSFETASINFKNAGVNLVTLSNYETLLEQANAAGYIREKDLETLKVWRKDPANWKK
ncbi:MAG: orotate phosphoribosyltransferase [Bacteroidota bacterium]|nr:orotate phosphoribosyltransferase [Bacteroidota bacterium]